MASSLVWRKKIKINKQEIFTESFIFHIIAVVT